MNIDGKEMEYHLFGRGNIPIKQESDNLSDPTTSNGMTRAEIIKYLQKK
jgi:hypothetical protein